MERAIAYLRVSTQRQHRSGLGLEAQRATIERFAANESLTIQAEYVEAESGKGSDALDRRPQLAAALAAAKAAKCSVVVAKLDRLSRDVAFVAGLMAQRVPFIVADLVGMPIHSCCTSMRRWPKRSGGSYRNARRQRWRPGRQQGPFWVIGATWRKQVFWAEMP